MVVLLAVEGDGEQRRTVFVAVLVVLNGDGGHAVYLLKLRGYLLRLFEGHVVQHYAAGAVGHELVVHQVEAYARLGAVREVTRDVVVYLRPAGGYRTEYSRNDVEKVECLSLVYYQCGEPFYGGLLFLLCTHLHCSILSYGHL